MSRPAPALHLAATGRPTPVPSEPPAHHLGASLSRATDHAMLVRFDLVCTARRHALRCIALVLEDAAARDEWEAAAADFRRAASTGDYDLRAASKAAAAMAAADTDGALAALTANAGLSVEEWIVTTRTEMGS